MGFRPDATELGDARRRVEALVQTLPDGWLVEAPRSGHPVQEDNAPVLIAAVREFLGRPTAQSG